MFEYCITNGKGLLIDYGIEPKWKVHALHEYAFGQGWRFDSKKCDDYCETGK